ncbi:uncharacterized protein LOC108047274 [Drosophila rhopaloa]|uniref:Uncharacterized protein LOC108047274 n=1 Tax=Drosophila rhopaloa TaxID=1041015 RepID=A0A6P4FBL2_DRORH|nr:uncharacterized protein LOC108047274 [Drosophila rhopaloa]
MEIDYSTYAQLSGFSYMPTPEEFYPEMRGGMQQQECQPGNDFDQGPRQMSTRQPHSAPIRNRCHQSHQRAMDMSDGLQANSYNPVRYQSTSASAYRCMVREQRRAKEMMSRNGLYSPIEASARYSGGDSNYY